jgi:hypothetical protein
MSTTTLPEPLAAQIAAARNAWKAIDGATEANAAELRAAAVTATLEAARPMIFARDALQVHFPMQRADALFASVGSWACPRAKAEKFELKRAIWDISQLDARLTEFSPVSSFSTDPHFPHSQDTFEKVAAFLERHASEIPAATARHASMDALAQERRDNHKQTLDYVWDFIGLTKTN